MLLPILLTTFTVTISNPNKVALTDAPVTLRVPREVQMEAQSATVMINGREIPCQLDDLDGNGHPDELAFVVDMKRKEKMKVEISYSDEPMPADRYPARVHAQMWFKDNDKTKSYLEKQHIPTDTVSETVDNMYSKMMHHGPAFENEIVAYRVYFDQKQSTDLYGKRIRQLELADGLWYSSEVPELVNERNFGDDIIMVGQTISVGALRGWDDSLDEPEFATTPSKSKVKDPCMQMIAPFDWRQAHIVAKGPIRTVVDMNVEGWDYKGHHIDIKSRYILYAGNRDCYVTHTFDAPLKEKIQWEDMEFVTGVMKVGIFNTDSVDIAGLHYEYNKKGLCASYGKDWPDGNHTLYPQMSTAALAVSINQRFVNRVIDRKEQILFGVHPNKNGVLRYRMAFCAPDKETADIVAQPWTPKRWWEWCKSWHKIRPVRRLRR